MDFYRLAKSVKIKIVNKSIEKYSRCYCPNQRKAEQYTLFVFVHESLLVGAATANRRNKRQKSVPAIIVRGSPNINVFIDKER